MKYNNYGEAHMTLGYFNFGSVHYTRVKFMETGEEEVFLTKYVKVGEFHSKNYNKSDVKETKAVTSLDEIAIAEKEVQTVESYRIQATSPKGKTLLVESDGLEAFASTFKLDIEAVKACIAGEQKTHRRWEFIKVD